METHSTVNDWVHKLDIADGLKQLLIDTDLPIESIIALSYREVSEILNIDPYVGKLIVEAVHSIMQERDHNKDLFQWRRALIVSPKITD